MSVSSVATGSSDGETSWSSITTGGSLSAHSKSSSQAMRERMHHNTYLERTFNPPYYAQRKRRTLPELLYARQTVGYRKRWNARHRYFKILPRDLTHIAAWNPSRLNNMILAVGPGTPASILMNQARHNASTPASSDESESSSDSSDSEAERPVSGRRRFVRSQNREQEDSDANSDDNDGDDDDDDSDNNGDDNDDDGESESEDSDEDAAEWRYRHMMDAGVILDMGAFEADGEAAPSSGNQINAAGRRPVVPSIQHSGCINTATWLDCNWRLSTESTGGEAIKSRECPTQLLTSGDDKYLKFWDVSNAMGTVSPWSGGTSTICPFSAPNQSIDEDELIETWEHRQRRRGTQSSMLPGCVTPLFSMHTGHYANVFHATACRDQPGKVMTCGADGYLRMSDLSSGQSTVIVDPDYAHEGISFIGGYRSSRDRLCFSHQLITRNVGLLCTQRGLLRFDVRLPPSEQDMSAILDTDGMSCKSCAVWQTSGSVGGLEETGSMYTFVGGESSAVILADIRMADSSKILRSYVPRDLSDIAEVPVSSLELSRDKQELLVNYESDQIYTFPALPHGKCAAGPTLDDLDKLGVAWETEMGDEAVREIAAYGGHLNRYTFLKGAHYAGPRDEYICTGSDSGCAWIYEKATGSVVSLLKADRSTCNGIVPHPTLPVFVSYGIDSTAKVWRASVPVDDTVDDSPVGRAQVARRKKYTPSSIVWSWKGIDRVLERLHSMHLTGDWFPDELLSSRTKESSLRMKLLEADFGSSKPEVLGNYLHNLPKLLRENLNTCLFSLLEMDEPPFRCPIEKLRSRICRMRTRHHADQFGLVWNAATPWTVKESIARKASSTSECDKCDLVLSPSDYYRDGWTLWENSEVYKGYEFFNFQNCNISDARYRSVRPESWDRWNIDRLAPSWMRINELKAQRKKHQEFMAEEAAKKERMAIKKAAKKEKKAKQAQQGSEQKTEDRGDSKPPTLIDVSNEKVDKVALSSDPGKIKAANQGADCTTSFSKTLKEEDVGSGSGSVSSRDKNKGDANTNVTAATAADREDGSKNKGDEGKTQIKGDDSDDDDDSDESTAYSDHSSLPIHQWAEKTMTELKEGGNEALKNNELDLAAHRYDMAIQYGALLFMKYPFVNLKKFTRKLQDFRGGRDAPFLDKYRWGDELNLLVTIHLNMSLLMLKRRSLATAKEQARRAKDHLEPFCVKQGVVIKEDGEEAQECAEVYGTAMKLQAKAYFRLGSAQFEIGDFQDAVSAFSKSVQCTRKIGAKPDKLVLRKLELAKQSHKTSSERVRKKFKFAFGDALAGESKKK